MAHRKLERYKYLYDRFSEILKFETFGVKRFESNYISVGSEVPYTPKQLNISIRKIQEVQANCSVNKSNRNIF